MTAPLLAVRLGGSGPALASTSRSAAAAFSTSARVRNDPPETTARKSPFSSASENMPAEESRDTFVPRGRKAAGRGRPQMLAPFPAWIQTGAKAYKYPKPGMGPNWIGETPFPLNPAFNPPPPIRQSTKTEIWTLHAKDPRKWTIRALSERFSIGLPRMEAILRLKALEGDWVAENKPLQSDFQTNMDRLLGAQERTRMPEDEPAFRTKDGSMRGVQHEEFSDSDPVDTPSVLGPALAVEMEARKSVLAGLHTGGPDPTALSEPKFVQPAKAKRASLRVVNVSGDSYKGAGTVEKNIRRAAKRELRKEGASKAQNDGDETTVKVKGTKVKARKTKVTLKGTKTRPEVRSTQPHGKPKVTPGAAKKVAPELDTKLA